jgi:hypothetical protein
MTSHHIPYDSPFRALCGAPVTEQDRHAEWPDCTGCQAKLRAEDLAFNELVNEPFDPSHAVPPRQFSVTDGYRPKGAPR